MRKKRSFKVNRCYHLISRIAHRAYFFDEGEKDRFVNLVRRVEQFCGVRVLGYAVMSNHFHIYVYLEDEHPVSEEELYAKICRLYCKDTLAGIIDKWERLKELAAQIASGQIGDEVEVEVEGRGDGWRRLEAFLSDVALMTNLDVRKNDPDLDRVTLSTVHQAKGMEWPVVIVPWLSEGMFPSAKASEEGRMDEERRLFYVVVTRAKDKLYMFVPQMRKMADGGIFPVDPSQFVKEIPPQLYSCIRVQSAPPAYGGYGGGYGSRGGYGGYSKPKTVSKYTWRKS